eukprot:1149028-Pelagomonas_calceolata.AAC.1
MQAQHGFQYLLDEMPEVQAPTPAHRQTVFMAASSSGMNHLQTRGKPVSLAVLSARMDLDDLITVLSGGCLLGWPIWANEDAHLGQLQ